MLWAALIYAAGIWVGSYAWRPPIWWLVAAGVFAISAVYLRGVRSRAASILALAVLFFIIPFRIQAQQSTIAAANTLSISGDAAQITAHVIRETDPQSDGFGGDSRRVDVISETISDAKSAGVRESGYELMSMERANATSFSLRRSCAIPRETFCPSQLPKSRSI